MYIFHHNMTLPNTNIQRDILLFSASLHHFLNLCCQVEFFGRLVSTLKYYCCICGTLLHLYFSLDPSHTYMYTQNNWGFSKRCPWSQLCMYIRTQYMHTLSTLLFTGTKFSKISEMSKKLYPLKCIFTIKIALTMHVDSKNR